jgi:hypothetical protein
MDALIRMPEQLDVTAAYGRRYPDDEAAKMDWVGGKDFSVWPGFGPYLSIRDSESLKSRGVRSVMIWRNKRESVEVAL